MSSSSSRLDPAREEGLTLRLQGLPQSLGSGVAAFALSCAACLAWQAPQWHTTPDKWISPRNFMTPFSDKFKERIVVRRASALPNPGLKVFSSNDAYWFGVDPDWTPERPSEKSVRFQVAAPDVRICIFDERDQLLEIVLKDHYANFQVTTGWINEKLLFIEVWWGRVLGTDMIFDVEKESFLYREMVNDGNIPFMQWHEPKRE